MGFETLTSWDGSRSWAPTRIHHPADEAEVARVVARVWESGGRIKPVGEALSWSDAAQSEGEAIRFDRMASVVEVDRERRLVRVQSGAPLSLVNEVLAANGLAFDNFGSIVMQSAGGYTGTGSHGTGGRTPILASYVREMRLVDGTGRVRVLNAETEPELFRVGRVHLGALGAVTELTFSCVDAFRLEEELRLVPWDRFLADLDALVDGNDYVKAWWLPYTEEVQVYLFNRTEQPPTRRTLTEWIDTSGISSHAFSQMMAMGRAAPGILPRMHRLVQRTQFRPRRRIDRSDRIIRYAGTIPRHQETEYAIDRRDAATALDRIRSMLLSAHESGRYHSNFPLEVRFVAADDIAMSPTRDRASCYVGPYIGSVPWSEACYVEFEAMMEEYAGRPHWGKTFHRTSAQFRDLYGEGFTRFEAARRTLDPNGVFRSGFVDGVFGVPGA